MFLKLKVPIFLQPCILRTNFNSGILINCVHLTEKEMNWGPHSVADANIFATAGGWRWSAVPQSTQSRPVSPTARSPTLIELRCFCSLPHPLSWTLLFFYTHIWDIYICVSRHIWCFLKKQKQKKTRWTKGIETLMVTRPLVFDCITDWLCFFVFSCFCLFILNYESCFYGCHFLQFFNGVHYFLSLLCCKLQDHYGTDKVFFSLPLHFNHASFFLFFFFLSSIWCNNGGSAAQWMSQDMSAKNNFHPCLVLFLSILWHLEIEKSSSGRF